MNLETELSIVGLVYNQSVVGTYGLVLSEKYGNRRFSIMIGEPEAQSIALKLNNKKPPRPLTHDLIHNLIITFGATISRIVIYDMVNDVFFSNIILLKDGIEISLDARTSDAVALAIRFNNAIFIKSDILEIVGTEFDSDSESKLEKEEINVDAEDLSSEELDLLSEYDLEELLDMAIKEEKYELAVSIRDAIKRKEDKTI
jgi:bifunctional DNase/RNase